MMITGVKKRRKFLVLIYTQIRRAFTVFGPLLIEPQLHQRGTFDSCNRYMNCASKKMCVISMHPAIEWM